MSAASFQAWLAMGGQAGFVWGAVAALPAALLAEWLLLRRRRRSALAQVRAHLAEALADDLATQEGQA